MTNEPEVVFTPAENFIWDTSVVMYDSQQLLARGEPTHEELLRIVQKAAALNQYHDLMGHLR